MSYEYLKLGFFTTSKKAGGKQIRNLSERLEAFGEFKVSIVLSENLDITPVADWPVFDICIPYHLEVNTIKKAIEYSTLRKNYIFNDLKMQENILSRKFIYETMKANGIPCLKNICYDHLLENNPDTFIETEDYLEINGQRIYKPFVEKPVSARRHDIFIYFNKAMGGGVRKLFRKCRNRSSKIYRNISNVRRDGVYMYERLIDSKKDIKVYAILPQYCYAEKRKSPNVDGIVDRNNEGFEIREICPLTHKEAGISKKVINVFKQNICGFDIIRENEKNSYVIDINGMSFVKYNLKYYDDAAHILRNHFLNKMKEINHPFYQIRQESRMNIDSGFLIDKYKGDLLLGVITVFRHGDRTPKQKVKIKTDDIKILSLLSAEKGAHELKFTENDDLDFISKSIKEFLDSTERDEETVKKLKIALEVIGKRSPGMKVQIKNIANSTVKKAYIICKWGGMLTEKGRNQCKRYAENFKKVYKGLDNFEIFTSKSMVYASDELRVQESARIFVDTLIGKKHGLKIRSNKDIEIYLNHASQADSIRSLVKEKISNAFNKPESFNLETKETEPIFLNNHPWIRKSFFRLSDPKERLRDLLTSTQKVVQTLDKLCERDESYEKNGESILQIRKRWKDVLDSFYKDDFFNVSNINDISDYLKYDLVHNFQLFKDFEEMYKNSQKISDFVSSAEYGITNNEKFQISKIITRNLLNKFIEKLDMIRNKNGNLKNFIYFASESILHALRNFLLCLKIASNVTVFENLDKAEFDYLSHVIIRLYEDTVKDENDPMRFYVNIMFSPGVWGNPFLHIDKNKYYIDKREILNPFVNKISFVDFIQQIKSAMD